ncbi:glycosyltransferase family 2 protein [Calothrix sp. PCC 6303]|uniref:glycosyltransferase family 2 protein n=1 Tax=Calothrix sp. PCC 6303 TaxID=1170562 RepID=UPI0002A05A27|nr:glycosyltransferase [Calothrix sp. PCC 6303]AFZ02571.1 glycosyl transferase family 2 [Calothrix sp. PCC 6303]
MGILELVNFSANLALVTISLLVLLLCVFLLVECVAALLPLTVGRTRQRNLDPKVAILIPAHNEELTIQSTIQQILSTTKQLCSLIVIADNCTDATATVARLAGATVIERQNQQLLGKGYAMDFGLNFLASNPPDVVIFIDADCQVETGTIEKLTKKALRTNHPIQATYLMETPSNPTPKDAISAFAFKVKNLVRSRGMSKLGLPCLLSGTGMAFPWSVIRAVDLASGDIVEDMKLGLNLNIAGYTPLYCPEARVIGNLPQNAQAATSQRTRWEHGHLHTISNYVPMLVGAAIRQGRLDLLGVALDICIPPLSLLVVIWIGLLVSSLLLGIVGSFWIPAMIATAAGVALILAIFTAWWKFSRDDLPLSQLLSIPIYILWKIPLYLKFFVQPQKAWVRTERD